MRYKGAIDSKEINKSYEDLIVKVKELTIMANEYESKQKSIALSYVLENESAKKRINDLLRNIEKDSIFPSQMTGRENIYINTKNEYAMPNCLTSKVLLAQEYIEDTYVEVLNLGEYEYTDYNLYGFLGNTPWIREIKTPPNVKEVKVTFIVNIPSFCNPSLKANFLEFNPFPFDTVKVTDIETANVYDNRYLSSVGEISNSNTHVVVMLDGKEVRKLAITLVQTSPSTDTPMEKIFHVGLSNLSLEYRSLNPRESVIDIEKEFTGQEFIKDIVPIHSYGNDIKPICSVYKKIGENNILVAEEFVPMEVDASTMVFRLKYHKNSEFVLKKVIIKK